MGKKIILQAGDIIGTNKLIEQDTSKEREYWFVECLLCHKIRSVRKDQLNNKCKECAIKNRKKYSHIQDDLTGKIFGNWTVLYKADTSNFWHCRCQCGNERDVFRGSLISGDSQSCGCLHTKSNKEKELNILLKKYQIPYITEYTNKDLKTPKGGQCRFDFAILNDNQDIICFIEYDGKQHFEYGNTWTKTSKDLEYRQQLDHFKDKYAKQINIPLIRLNKESDLEESIKNIKNSNFTNILKYQLISNDQKDIMSKQKILDIVTDLKNSSLTISQIAEKFHVSRGTIYRINNGESYLNLFNNKSYPIRHSSNICCKIQCINTQEIFDSIQAAAKWCNIASTNITRCAKGNRPTAGKHPITGKKLKWRYVENEI